MAIHTDPSLHSDIDLKAMELKSGIDRIEALDSSQVSLESAGFDEQATKRLLRKIDLVLLPFLALLYL